MLKICVFLVLFVLELTSLEVEALKCVDCYSYESWDECHRDSEKPPLPCSAGSQRCYSFMTVDSDAAGGNVQRYFEKGCTPYADEECNTQKPCQDFEEFLKILHDDDRKVVKCEYRCCEQDNCNAPGAMKKAMYPERK